MRKFRDGRDWFFEKRYGLFIHWGLYAIPGWHEQMSWRGRMPRQEYEKLVDQFNPVKFDPEQWLDDMQEAGMEYLCFTTKHHDGFCMWDTQYTDYNVMHTPYKKDIVGMLSDACHKRGIPFGIYYSIPDWHHKNYPNAYRHHEMFGPRPGDEPDEDKYMEYVRNQVRELLTGYGEISEMFWDINVLEYHDPSFNEMVRALQPNCVINDRGMDEGDFSTPERRVPDGFVFRRPTEGVQSLGRESWGYKTDEDYYSCKYLMQSIDRVLAMGGNYKLNVGPKPDGTWPDQDLKMLRRIGDWYGRCREAFGDAQPATTMVIQSDLYRNPRDEVLLTRRGNDVYVHLYRDPQASAVVLRPLIQQPKRATLLNDGRELEAGVDLVPFYWREKPYLRIRGLPVDEITDEVMIIKLEFAEKDCM